MSIVSDTITAHLPAKRKTTPSGWTSFDAPCCVHNNETRDTKQRGGLIQEGDVVSFHCFNCGFKTGWQPGRHMTFKLRKLLEWLNVPDDNINKLALDILRMNEGIEAKEHLVEIPEFSTVQLPEDAVRIQDIPDYNEHNLGFNNFIEVVQYMASRDLNLDDTNYYWTTKLGYRDRFIIPFYYEERIVGWTARTVKSETKAKYLTESQPGYVYGLDEQRWQKAFCIVCEGPLDAIHVEGCALLGSEVGEQQAMLLNRLNKDIIVVPDRDSAGKKLVEQAIDLGWQVSMPNWDSDINDIGDAVAKYGRLYTLYSIASAAESSSLKIKLRMKKWF